MGKKVVLNQRHDPRTVRKEEGLEETKLSSLIAHNPNPDMPHQADRPLIGAQVINFGLFPPHPTSPLQAF